MHVAFSSDVKKALDIFSFFFFFLAIMMTWLSSLSVQFIKLHSSFKATVFTCLFLESCSCIFITVHCYQQSKMP